jgi:hypothetical protein
MKKSLIEKITKYNKKANLPPKLDKCHYCHVENTLFKQHDSRERKVRILLENLSIQMIIITLFRWKCIYCNRTFTFYPCFLMPYKRFATDSIMKLNENYIHIGETSYRKIVRPNGSHYAYDDNNKFCELSHSTVWNWVQTLANSSSIAKKAINLLVKKNNLCEIHRKSVPINPRKYQSKQRKELLIKAEEVLRTYRFLILDKIEINLFPKILIS